MASNYDKLIENIDKLQYNINSISGSSFSINDYMLPNDEIIKNLIKEENPNISPNDIELMVYGYGNLEDLDNIRNGITANSSNSLINTLDLENQVDSETKSILITEIVNNSLINNTIYPLNNQSDPYYKKVEELKTTISNTFNLFQQDSKDLVLETNMASLMIVNSIPGALLSGSVAPFVPNIPGSISTLSNVMITLSQLKGKYISLLPHLSILKKINLVVGGRNLNIISSILNTLINILIGPIVKILKLINDFIRRAINALLGNSDARKEEKRARKIARQLRNFNYLPNNNFSKVDEDDKDDVELILEEWDIVNVGSKKPGRLGVVKRKNTIDEAITILENSLSQIEDFNNILIESDEDNTRIVYDVELSSGEILYGLTLDDVNSLKEKYEIIFSSNG
jgi:hypothetical protein